MHVLDLLRGWDESNPEDFVEFEYRLLCSGVVYNGSVQSADWHKSLAARVLCDDVVRLLVVSNPIDEFPQEIALQFRTPVVTEGNEFVSLHYHPDNEVARDVAALLSLLFRRLVTVAAKTREVHSEPLTPAFGPSRDVPTPFVTATRPIYWPNKPASVTYRLGEPVEVTDYNPRPLGIDYPRLKTTLLGLPSVRHAESLILSARLYAAALTHIHQDVDLAYELLIAAVEAVASEVLRDYSPSDDRKADVKASVKKLAMRFGVSAEQARLLAIEACQGLTWASDKFREFLSRFCSEDLWGEDDVFRVPEPYLPSRDDLGAVLRTVYAARGKLTHRGVPFPSSASVGIGPTVPIRAAIAHDWTRLEKPFPPVAWFERAVNNGLRGYVDHCLADCSPNTAV